MVLSVKYKQILMNFCWKQSYTLSHETRTKQKNKKKTT